MLVYRICLAKYADGLFTSGQRARWNYPDEFILYTAASRSLAYPENIVHRSGEGLNAAFRVMVIDLPDDLPVAFIDEPALPTDWASAGSYGRCQPLGSAWYTARRSAVLRVPSSIVPTECNFLLNTRHPDFGRVRLLAQEPFQFDARLKAPGA